MEASLIQLRSDIEIINPFTPGRKPRFTKTGRLKAVTALHDALSRKHVIAALTAVSKQEMIRGPTDEADKFLGWAELSCVMLLTVDQVCMETTKARTMSRSGSVSMRPVFMTCFRSVVKLALQHGPRGVLRHLVCPFLAYAHSWLSEPLLRELLADQIWPCVRELLQDEVNRALLQPRFIRDWVDACFEQLTGRGALWHSSNVVTNIAGEVLQVLGGAVESYDTLSQTRDKPSPSKMEPRRFEYFFIAEKCCLMLILAESMPRRKAREVQTVAFRTLAEVLSDHALDVLGSNALDSIINASLKPILTCWSEKKYHIAAASFCKVLLLLAPCDKRLIDTIRHRILVDLREESSSAIIRAGQEISTDYIDATAACFTFCECLEFADAAETRPGVVILWLRTAFAIISRRVLKHGTNVLVEAIDVLDQCSKAAITVTAVLKKHGNLRESEYLSIVRCCTMITNVVAVIAENIQSSGNHSTAFAKSSWQDLYKELREHAMKAKYSVRSRGTSLSVQGSSFYAEDLILQTLGLLCSLEILDNTTLDYTGAEGSQVGSAPYPISCLLPTSVVKTTRYEIQYFRNLICRTGLVYDSGGHLRFQLICSFLDCCQEEHGYLSLEAEVLEEAAASTLALVRGECNPSDKSAVFHMSRRSVNSPSLIALHSFHVFFGLRPACQKIVGEGNSLVRGTVEQDFVWKDCNSWTPQVSVLASSAAEAVIGEYSPTLTNGIIKLNSSRHFSIDSQLTVSLEKEMLRKLEEVVNGAVISKRTENTSIGRGTVCGKMPRDQWKSDEVSAFVDSRALGKGLRVITFLSCYLSQGIRLGLISLSMPDYGTEEDAIQELGQLLLYTIRCVAEANPDNLIRHYHLTQETLKWSSRLFCLIDTDLDVQSCDNSESIWSKLAMALSSSVTDLTTSVSKVIFQKLEQKTLKNVDVIQRFVQDDFSTFSSVLGDTQIRKRIQESAGGPKRLQKRRRLGSPAFSEESINSNGNNESESPEFAERGDDSIDVRSEDSDDYRDFASDEQNKNMRAESTYVSPNTEKTTSFWRKGFGIIEVIVREFKLCRETVTESCINGLKAIDDVERILNPDDFERAALLSSFVDPSTLDARRSIWNILLTIGTGNAVRAAATNILKVGKYWKRLEQIAHDYVGIYSDLVNTTKKKRKHYPVPPDIETSRVIFLDSARMLFERVMESNTTSTYAQAQQPESELRRLTAEIVRVSEYFRSRHTFRMPRVTRIAYVRFGCSFVKLAYYFQTRGTIDDLGGSEETSLMDTASMLQSALRRFLIDSEGLVRFVSSKVIPKVMVLQSFSEEDDPEGILKDCLQERVDGSACQDLCRGSMYGALEEMDDTVHATWSLSNTERDAYLVIRESFQHVRAPANGYSALIALAELAMNCEDLTPQCVIEIMNRVSANSRFLVSGYHVLLRLCAALKYRSPHHFYAAYARLILPKWFETQESTEELNNFPASLFVDHEHHKEGILFDWMRQHQTSLLQHILVREKTVSLDLTMRFSEALHEESACMLKGNITAFALLYPMQFTNGLHDRGRLIWHAVDSLLEGKAMALMSENKSEVINAFLRSVSTNWQLTALKGKARLPNTGNLGFWRDTKKLKPPLYDPLVIALAINHLFASNCDLFIVQRSVLQGSLFAEVRDEQTGVVLASRFVNFLKECQKGNVTLLRALISTYRFFEGPPSPQPKRSRLDAFFCVGMLWRMLDDAILIKPKNERLAFFRLIAKGFQYKETASDASWLLSDVQTKLMNLQRKYPNFTVSESDIWVDDSYRGCLTSMTDTKERQMYELLSTVSPVLVSIMVSTTNSYQSNPHSTASKALNELLSLCSEECLWPTILCNGPFLHHKVFKDARKVYEKARSLVEVAHVDNKVDTLLSSMARFREVYKRLGASEYVVNILACLQEMYQMLDEGTVHKLSKKIKSEAWLRSNGMDQQMISEINETLSCFIDVIYKFSPPRSCEKGFHFSTVCKGNSTKPGPEREVFEDSLLQEVARVLGVLGLLHPQPASFVQAETCHKSIPARQTFGCYEDVEGGIRLSLILLQTLLQSNLALQAQVSLNTLFAILKTGDGRRIYIKERELLRNLESFKSTERGTKTSGQGPVSCPDPLTGALISLSECPTLCETALWSLPKEQDSAGYSWWMRKLCTVLACSCRSNALNALTTVCFSSYEVSCAMLPYLFMDIICDLDDAGCSRVSKHLRHHVLLNMKTPVPILRAFVHALDVLCQIGLEVVSSKGAISWVRNMQQSPVFPFYYVLEVPYLEAAKAALRSGAYFSALRYAQLYIDQRLTKAELKLSTKGVNHSSKRRYSSSPLSDPVLESAELMAREKAIPLVREAMIQISEPDGIRAFGENCSLARSAANIASLDGDWSRSLSALDVANGNLSSTIPERSELLEGRDQGGLQKLTCSIDFQRELDVLHSFIGLGTIHIATDYWEGLRNRVVKLGTQEKIIQNTSTQSCLDQLNELRYAAAWKLEQWESPPVLPQTRTRGIRHHTEPLGFHKAVYLTLRSLKTGRTSDIRGILSRARKTTLQQLRDGSSTLSAKCVFENASRLYVCYLLERAAFQEMVPNPHVKNPTAIRHASNRDRGNNKLPFSSQSHHVVGASDPAVIAESVDYIIKRDTDNEDVIRQILGHHYGVDDELFREGLVLSRDAFHSGILADDLPVLLARCLKKSSAVASMSATISARILSKGGVGAWPRATSCLGTPESSLVNVAPQKDVIAWRLQETRLRWSANHDAPSKKQALAAVKDIISSNLGGKALDRASNDVSDSLSFQQSLSWQRGDIDEETLALLRSEACCLAAKWSLDMKTHEPMDLFQMYLESGLTAALQPTESKRLVGRAHFAMASFADAQINNIDTYRRSRKYDGMVTAVREMEQKIANLKKMKTEKLLKTRSESSNSRRSSRSSRSAASTEDATAKIGRDLDLLIRMEQKKAVQDRARLQKLNETYQKWQVLACQHFALSLCAGSTQDLRAAFRMVALWLDAGPMRCEITKALMERAKQSKQSSVEVQKIIVPVSKLLPLAPQLASRLNKSDSMGDTAFQEVLSGTITEMAGEFPAYCLWQLLALSNATRDSGGQEKYSSLYRGDRDKKDAADDILNRLHHLHGDTVSEMKKVADAYILLSETSPKRKKKEFLELRGYDIAHLGELSHVPVPTVPIPLNATDHFEKIPHIMGFEKRASVFAGLSLPLQVVCLGSDGNRYPQIVKGRDDLRGDAVMEQMFTILNSLLEKDVEAARRSLHIRTYRVIPLSPFSGIMQFVSNTKRFRQILVEKEKKGNERSPRPSLHERYHPKDIKDDTIMEKARQCLETQGRLHNLVRFLAQIWPHFKPAFRFFLIEQWPDPGEWFNRQLSYSRSVAVMSMVGFILGLGDRHLSNILLDISTAEVVHIDFGIAFEQGKLLPTPEHMPFRLTRDIVDGFGIAGVEGVFRRCSEITLSVMRRNRDVMLTVIEVLLHDPMYSWALSPEEVLQEQNQAQGSDRDYFGSNELSRSPGDSSIEAVARTVKKKMNGSQEAQRALNRISEKLDGLEGTERLSVEAHVARLIDEAQAFHVIAPVFPGWSPWV